MIFPWLALLVGCMYYLSPIIKPLPVPTGSYAIGVTTYHFKDIGRKDPHSGLAHDRELPVHIWYPAVLTRTTKAHYLLELGPVLQKELKDYYYVPENVSARLVNAPTHAVIDAPISTSQAHYPVIVLLHGLNSMDIYYTTLIQELVSHGYIVATITFPYSASVALLSDGTAATFNQQGIYASDRLAEQEINLWQTDTLFVVQELTRINERDPKQFLNHKFDLTRLGVIGHSFGGSTALRLCRMSGQFKAGINLDGGLDYGTNPLEAFARPFLTMLKDTQEHKQAKSRLFDWGTQQDQQKALRGFVERVTTLCTNLHENGYLMILKQAGHHTFSDLPLIKQPLKRYFKLQDGTIDPYHAIDTINNYVGAFFDKYLKEQESSLLPAPGKTIETVDLIIKRCQ